MFFHVLGSSSNSGPFLNAKTWNQENVKQLTVCLHDLNHQRGFDAINFFVGSLLFAMGVWESITNVARIIEGQAFPSLFPVAVSVFFISGFLCFKTATLNIRERRQLRRVVQNPEAYRIIDARVTRFGFQWEGPSYTTRRVYFAADGMEGVSPHIWIGFLQGKDKGSTIYCVQECGEKRLIFVGFPGHQEPTPKVKTENPAI
jgi:hypothetical protein